MSESCAQCASVFILCMVELGFATAVPLLDVKPEPRAKIAIASSGAEWRWAESAAIAVEGRLRCSATSVEQ